MTSENPPLHSTFGLPKIDLLLKKVSFLGSLVASVLILAIMLLICADVVSRNLFSAPLNGVDGFVSYSVVACVFLQIGNAIRNDSLIGTTVFLDIVERNWPVVADTLEMVFRLCGLAVLYFAMAYLWSDFLSAWNDAEFVGATGAFRLPTWPFKFAVAVGSTIACMEILARLLRGLRGTRPRPPAVVLTSVVVSLAVMVGGYLVFDHLASAGLDRVMIGFGALAFLFLLVAMGMPIVFVLMITSFVGIWLVRDNPMVAFNSLGNSASSAVRSSGFGVIPLFVLMGLLLDRAGVGRDAFQIAAILTRRFAGGLGIATVGANAIFASITGSSIASATVFSRIAVPPMMESGYSKKFALGIVAGSSVLGMLIPPSLLMIVYGLLAEASIGDLFVAGIVPGLLLAASFSILIHVLARFVPSFSGAADSAVRVDNAEEFSGLQILARLMPISFIVFLVMGGIYGGFFSPTEAGAVGAFGAVVVAAAKRTLSLNDFKSVVLDTGAITAGLLLLMIAANLYGRMLTMTTIPMVVARTITSLDLNLVTFSLIFMVMVICLGMILDSISIMLIVLPIAFPILNAMSADLVWFGIITVISIEIGLLTPPFGLSVYVVKGSLPPGFATLGEIFYATTPFVLTMVLVTVFLIFVPQLTTLLL